jgi:hypothetical protein
MIRKIFFIVIVTSLSLLAASICSAKKFTVDGFIVDVMWKVKREKLVIWGDVEGGRTCRQINLDIYFANSKQVGSCKVDTFTRDRHRPNSRSPFNGEGDVRNRKDKNYWFVDRIYLNCLK